MFAIGVGNLNKRSVWFSVLKNKNLGAQLISRTVLEGLKKLDCKLKK